MTSRVPCARGLPGRAGDADSRQFSPNQPLPLAPGLPFRGLLILNDTYTIHGQLCVSPNSGPFPRYARRTRKDAARAAVATAGKVWALGDDALPLPPFKELPEILGPGQKCAALGHLQRLYWSKGKKRQRRARRPKPNARAPPSGPPGDCAGFLRSASLRAACRKAPCRARRRFCASVALDRRWRRRWQ